MDITITPHTLQGNITVIPSKSQAHRLMICAAFADRPTQLMCPDTNQDIEATADCLRSLGAQVDRTESGYIIHPVQKLPETSVLNCRESGSTLRFMLPVVGALGVKGTFLMEGRLPRRPLSPLWGEMERMGCVLTRPTEASILCQGKLRAGSYSIDGGVSSQFITGLLFALNLLPEKSELTITGKVESKPYIALTRNALCQFGIDPGHPGGQVFRSPDFICVEGDWSNGAFFLTANFIGSALDVVGLNADSAQGDRAVVDILTSMEAGTPTVNASDIPDLVPVLSVAAACKNGAVFTNISRLRLKESDRVASVCAMLEALGGKTESTENTLTIHPCRFVGGTVDACGDHRIAMAAAIAATAATGPVTILGAHCAAKSYPKFWEEYARLGGKYEQYLR